MGKGDILSVFFIMVVVAIAALIGAAMFYDFGLSTGHGSHVGYVSEIENEGWLWQPTTITVLNIQPTYSNKDTSWTYAVANSCITEIAKAALVNKSVVTVTYETRQVTANWEYAGRTMITGIEIESGNK
jgi:hypothetical protein